MNFVYFGFVVTISLSCHVQCENGTLSEFEERAAIVNGYNAPNRPFYVELRIWKSKFLGKYGLCGGTIITKQHVLSAAHCFADGYQSVDVYVKDFSNPNSKKTTIPAARVYYNSGYTGKPKYYNDVAVLKLSQSVSSSKVLPMCTKSYSQYTIAVCGMGLIKANSDDLANRLQETQLQEYSNCPGYRFFDQKKQVCLGPSKGQTPTASCSGDSGGPAFPLTSSGQPKCVYGIVSYGFSSCNKDGIYTRVSDYASWINQHL